MARQRGRDPAGLSVLPGDAELLARFRSFQLSWTDGPNVPVFIFEPARPCACNGSDFLEAAEGGSSIRRVAGDLYLRHAGRPNRAGARSADGLARSDPHRHSSRLFLLRLLTSA